MNSNIRGYASDSCSPDPYTLSTSAPAAKFPVVRAVTPADRHRLIAEAAYRLAERRGFEPGHELEDWLTAEQQITGA